MSKHEKLLEKLKQCSNTFEWSDLVTILTRLGYTLTEMEGSRVRFFNAEKDHMIRMHKPHPENYIKGGALKDVKSQLKDRGFL